MKTKIQMNLKEKLENKKQEQNGLAKKARQERGITLIALIVTIIVLLILAGVTITAVLGEGGIIEKAEEAKEKTEAAIEAQEQDMADLLNEIEGIMRGETPDPTPPPPTEPTLKVKLTVDEAEVTGTTIPVTAKVTTIDGDAELTEGITYEFYKNEESNESSLETGKYTFNNLDEAKSYTLKCKASKQNGEWGIGEVTVISFKVRNTYYRATEGMSWKDLANSSYKMESPVTLEEFKEECPLKSGEEYQTAEKKLCYRENDGPYWMPFISYTREGPGGLCFVELVDAGVAPESGESYNVVCRRE